MTPTTRSPLVADYLERLERAAAALPRGRRAELVAEIEAHIEEAAGPHPSDAELLTVLDRLGEPEEIVRDEVPAPAPDPRGLREWGAIWLLLFGGLVAGFGWLAGLILLWSSRAWTTRDKWIGTLVVPGGLALPFLYFAIVGMSAGDICSTRVDPSGRVTEHCTNEVGTAEVVLLYGGLAVLLIAPIATAVYLARRARRGVRTT